jgi:BirA family biotin operon repressor/biotin-[acetyl-CoA-carboxylase] ligase
MCDVRNIDMLSSEKIAGQLNTKWAARMIVYKDVTGSTNNDARELSKEGAENGTLVVADKQETGRGSNGRGWETPAGTNIAMSLVLRPGVGIERIPMLTLVMGLSVAEGIELALGESASLNPDRQTKNAIEKSEPVAQDTCHADGIEKDEMSCRIKWPNDVVLGGRKVCGILTELHLKPEGGIDDAIIGVGINVNMVDFPDEIKEVAGSLLTQTGVRVDRNTLVARVMERFEENYEKFESTGDMSLLKDGYEARLVNKGQRVMILDTRKVAVVASREAVDEKFRQTKDVQCQCLGITELGALLVRMDSGELREINSGEVSVRGIYGYV